MALVSPGVEIDIINESVYGPTAVATVPLVFIATATDKLTPDGTATATGTTAANANQLYLASSQRDLVTTFGTPTFYKDSNGTPLHGYEINEYGLMAAYSALGVSNRVYVVRADVDLSQLVGTSVRPSAAPADGTHWFDTADTSWGVFEWDASTNTFNQITDILVVTDTALLNAPSYTSPLSTLGQVGQYAVTFNTAGVITLFYKDYHATWQKVGTTGESGTSAWQWAHPTVQGTATNPTLTISDTLTLNGQNIVLTGTTVDSLVSQINGAIITGVTSYNNQGRLEIFLNSGGSSADSSIPSLTVAGTAGLLTALGITAGTYYPPEFVFAPHTQVPQWRSTDPTPRPSGSVWIKTTTPNGGANYSIQHYNALTASWTLEAAPFYSNDPEANNTLDPLGGGKNIALGTLMTRYDALQSASQTPFLIDGSTINPNYNAGMQIATTKVYERSIQGEVSVTGTTTVNQTSFTPGWSFTISVSRIGQSTWTDPVTVVLSHASPQYFRGDVLAKGIPEIDVIFNTTDNITGTLTFVHKNGGSIKLVNTSDAGSDPLAVAGFTSATPYVRLQTDGSLLLSGWTAAAESVGATTPTVDPADGTYWYYSSVDDVDVMIHNGTTWVGYQTLTSDARGYNLTMCDPNGPIIAATAPTTQSDATVLVYGDLWVDTSDLENYPQLYRWESVSGKDQWVLIDNADQTTENGILFADARWDTDGTTDPISDALPTIKSLLTSSHLDLDAPDPALYPRGMLLWNTRRSSYNVKKFESNYFNATSFPNDTLPTMKNTWVNASGNRTDGSPYMGRKAARTIVVGALKSAIDTNTQIREEQYQYNLIVTPGYPEVAAEMTALNNDIRNNAFIIADTPFRLAANGTAIENWAAGKDDDSITTADPYTAVYYPSGWSTNSFTTGNTDILVPPSHMALRVMLRNDNIAFPWFAPAGTRRGVVDNATRIGYIDSTTGEVQFTGIAESLRDTLYENKINPFTLLPGVGLVAYGQKTLDPNTDAMDRVNVSRLVVYLRGRLQQAVKQFLFEPNDKITRDEALQVVNSILNDLVAKRGIYDYIAVCDTTNNTPDRIDRNELWIDVGIEPEKAIEFIYVPVRILNTGAISQVGK